MAEELSDLERTIHAVRRELLQVYRLDDIAMMLGEPTGERTTEEKERLLTLMLGAPVRADDEGRMFHILCPSDKVATATARACDGMPIAWGQDSVMPNRPRTLPGEDRYTGSTVVVPREIVDLVR